MLTHALRRLGRAAAREPAVAGVLWPLLEAATDPGHPEADALADDGARLLRAAIGAAGSVPPPAVSRVLLPRVLRQAGSGRVGERAGYFSILESAVLLGGCGGALLVGGGGEGGGGAAASANGNSSGAAAAASTSRPSPAGDGVSAAAVAIARALSDALEAATADAVEAAVSAAKDGGGGGAGGGEGGGMMEAEQQQQQQGQLQQSSSLDRDGRNGPPPPPPPPPPPRGALPRPGRGATAAARAAARARRAAREAGAARDALAALSLASAMLQTDLPLAGPALSRSGALRGAAALLAPPPGAGPLPSAVCEAAAGVVARVLFASPGELRALVSPAPSGPTPPPPTLSADAAVGRLLDAWLRVAGSRQLEEVLGVPAARAAGRARRAAAAAALCRVATAPAGPPPPPPVAALGAPSRAPRGCWPWRRSPPRRPPRWPRTTPSSRPPSPSAPPRPRRKRGWDRSSSWSSWSSWRRAGSGSNRNNNSTSRGSSCCSTRGGPRSTATRPSPTPCSTPASPRPRATRCAGASPPTPGRRWPPRRGRWRLRREGGGADGPAVDAGPRGEGARGGGGGGGARGRWRRRWRRRSPGGELVSFSFVFLCRFSFVSFPQSPPPFFSLCAHSSTI